MSKKLDRENFKKVTKMIESSGGRNILHSPVYNEIHKGNTAIGDYALMPETINELIKSRPIDLDKDEQRRILNMSADEKRRLLVEEKPEYQEKFMDAMIDKLSENYGGDPLKMNYAYEHGHNLSDDTVSKKYKKARRHQQFLNFDDSEQGMANFAIDRKIYPNSRMYRELEKEPTSLPSDYKAPDQESLYKKIMKTLSGK